MPKVFITDLVLRDAHQSLFATRMLTSDMVPIAEKLDKVGFWSLESWGGATFDSCIRFLNEDPWQRIRTLKKAMPNTPQQMLLRGQNLLGYRHYADDVVEKFVARAAESGVDVFRIFDALNDPRNFLTSIQAVKKAKKHAQATISYATTPVHTNESFVELGTKLKELGADSICIKDMAGLLKPKDAFALVSALKKKVGLPVHLHSHATTGMSVATLLKGIEAGADMIDTAISSMAMGTSHSPTETMVEILKGTEYDTGLDVKLLVEIAAYFREVRKKYKQFESSFLGADTRILVAQVPGGMLSNLESQLKEQNALDKLDAVLDEISVVQKDCGYPPLVTPTSQIVGSQAVFNVVFGRYKKMTGETKDLLAGKYGKTPAAPNPELVAKALSELGLQKAVTERPADLIPREWDSIEADLKTKLGTATVSVDDVLTYAMFPQIAPKFFATRDKGPVDFKPEPVSLPVAAPATQSAPSSTAADGPATYLVSIDGKEFSVTVKKDSVVKAAPAPTPSAPVAAPVSAPAPIPASAPNPPAAVAGGTSVDAPVAGIFLRTVASEGSQVSKGQTVAIMESMKMELEVTAPVSGTIHYTATLGENIKAGQSLATIA